jgi:cysteine desulfurase
MKVYLDNSATTKMDKSVFAAMRPYFCDIFGNASSLHLYGQEAENAVAEAREKIAKAINCKPDNIYFTSGGTESNNWAIKGAAHARKHKGNHIIVSAIEHAAVLEAAADLEKEGFRISRAPVGNDGIIDLRALERLMTSDTILVSVMLANNEIGTIQPIKEISALCKERGILLHSDAVQALGSIPVNVNDLEVDLLSLSAHKLYGPKGIGALYIRSGIRPARLISGGHQERTRRGGTKNVPLIVGFGAAAEKAVANIDKTSAKIRRLRDYLVKRVLSEIPHVIYNGHKTKRLPQNANFIFEFVESESILTALSMRGVAVSSGSACSSAKLLPSHVLLAIGLPLEISHCSIRASLGKYNTKNEVDYAIEKFKSVVEKYREVSPLMKKIDGEIHSV